MGSYFYTILAFICFSLSNAPNNIDPYNPIYPYGFRRRRGQIVITIFSLPGNISYDSNKVKFEFEMIYGNISSQKYREIRIRDNNVYRTAICNISKKKYSCEYDLVSEIPYYQSIIINDFSGLYPILNTYYYEFEIPFKIIDLKYKRTYFTFKNDYFFIEVERSIFPFAILIDFDINRNNFATCIYNDLILNCSVDLFFAKFKPKQDKYYCPINWTNSIDEKLLIKLNYDSFWASNAEYVENKWTFEIFSPINYLRTDIIDNYYYYAGIVLIKQDGTKNFTISNCSINTYYDKCIVESDNQEQND